MKRYVSNTGEDSARTRQQALLQMAVAGRDKDALEWILSNKQGRWFLARMMKNEGLHASSFTGNSGTFYNEGRREVVCDIYNRIRAQMGLRGVWIAMAADEILRGIIVCIRWKKGSWRGKRVV